MLGRKKLAALIARHRNDRTGCPLGKRALPGSRGYHLAILTLHEQTNQPQSSSGPPHVQPKRQPDRRMHSSSICGAGEHSQQQATERRSWQIYGFCSYGSATLSLSGGWDAVERPSRLPDALLWERAHLGQHPPRGCFDDVARSSREGLSPLRLCPAPQNHAS